MTPEEVVRSFIAAHKRLDVDAIVDAFTPDGVWHNMPYQPANGRDEIRKIAEDFFSRTAAADLQLINVAVNGNVVLVERIDHIDYAGREIHAPCMGAFEIEGDKIKAWRDYFDSAGHSSE